MPVPREVIVALVVGLASVSTVARPASEATRKAPGNPSPGARWFADAGLGLFVHWGISTVHGGIDLSWGMMDRKPWDPGNKAVVTPESYWALAKRFAPDRFAPDRWLRAARQAGFRYAVFTARHHDGYAMWPSIHGDMGVRTHLPGRDLVGEFVKACRRNGLKVGLYYSAPDWYYRRKYISFRFGSEDAAAIPEQRHLDWRHRPVDLLPGPPADLDEGYRAYVRCQVLELLTLYGQIDMIWFDGGPDVISIDEIRQLQPGIVVNPRMHGTGDFETFECRMPDQRPSGLWEMCDIWPQGPWGYTTAHESYKPVAWLLDRLAATRSWRGNFLVNVSQRPTGEMPDEYYDRMRELTRWMRHSGKSLLNAASPSPGCTSNVTVTQSPRGRLYLHMPAGMQTPVTLKVDRRPKRVTMLSNGHELAYNWDNGEMIVHPPAFERSGPVDVIAVDP